VKTEDGVFTVPKSLIMTNIC